MAMDVDKFEEAKRLQDKGKMVESLQSEGILPEGEQEETQSTEYAKATGKLVDKLHSPKTETDINLHSNIPKEIFTNLIQLSGIEHGTRELIRGDSYLYYEKEGRKRVSIMRNDPLTGELKLYRDVSANSLSRTEYYQEFMSGYNKGIKEMLVSIEGSGRKDGVAEISSLTNSEKMLLEAQNNANSGFFRKAWNKAFASGNK